MVKPGSMPTSLPWIRRSRAETMKRSHPDFRVGNQRLDSLPHLAGRLVGEGDGEDVLGGDSRAEQVNHPAGDDPGFSRPCAGKYQQRALNVRNCLALGGRQISKQIHGGRFVLVRRPSTRLCRAARRDFHAWCHWL